MNNHGIQFTQLVPVRPESGPVDLTYQQFTELDLWTLEETAGFLQQWLTQSGGESQEFDEQAIEVLHELAEGDPRRVRQLAELTLLAGSGMSNGPVGEDVVQAAYYELCVGR